MSESRLTIYFLPMLPNNFNILLIIRGSKFSFATFHKYFSSTALIFRVYYHFEENYKFTCSSKEKKSLSLKPQCLFVFSSGLKFALF